MMNITIRQKIAGFSLMGLGFVLIVGATGWISTAQMAESSQQMTTNTSALKSQLQADMMHDALRGDAMRAMLAGLQQDQAQFASIKEDLAEHRQTFTEAIETLEVLATDAQVKAAAQALKPALAAYLTLSADVVGAGLNDPPGAAAMLPAFQAAFKDLEDKMGELNELLENKAQEINEVNSARAARASTLIIAASLLAGLASLAAGAWLGRGIVRPIAEATRMATTVASGDLTSRILAQGRDEVGQLLQALQAMNDQLADVVGAVRQSGDSIATGSSQIASGNADLSERTERQASSLQQTASSMAQLASTVEHNSAAARQATELAASASHVAARGGSVVDQVVATMQDISGASRRIADIIGVIDGIAFQTNILALNAAVEAARAGEQGRGFAVVASEVRGLAHRSAEAAKEIKGLIQDSVQKVDAGSRLVGDAGLTMKDIVDHVRRVSELIGEISRATAEQNLGLGQVSAAVGNLDHVTQQNAALVEESAAASESLKSQAESLVEAVRIFKLA